MKNLEILKPTNFIFANLVKQIGRAEKDAKYIDTIIVRNTTFQTLTEVLNSIKDVYQYQNEIDDDGEEIENNYFSFDFEQNEFSILVLETLKKGTFEITIQNN